jgi:hypothetical protein
MLAIYFTPMPTPPSPAFAGYFITYFGYLQSVLIEAYLQATLANWTDSTPPSYSSGSYTIAWSHNGNTWTWTITYTVGTVVHAIVVTVTSTSSGWSITITEDGVPWLTGSINSSGTAGTATISDPTGGTSGNITTVWTSASSPYSYKYTITAIGDFVLGAGDSATSATVVLQTKSDGTAWTWSYSDNMGGSASHTYP